MKKLNQTILRTIANADNATLDAIIDQIKARRGQIQTQIGGSYPIGDTVKFDARSRGIITGTISKINQKTIVVKTTMSGTWKVTPSLLKKVA